MDQSGVPHPVVKNADAATGDRIVKAWEAGFWEGVRTARESDVFMPRDWMERASDASQVHIDA
jgi:hypothetical protein